MHSDRTICVFRFAYLAVRRLSDIVDALVADIVNAVVERARAPELAVEPNSHAVLGHAGAAGTVADADSVCSAHSSRTTVYDLFAVHLAFQVDGPEQNGPAQNGLEQNGPEQRHELMLRVRDWATYFCCSMTLGVDWS